MFHYRKKWIAVSLRLRNLEKMMPKTLFRLSKYFFDMICGMLGFIIAH